MTLISATCHCSAVEFEIESNLSEFTTCDCSLFEMRNAIMVKVPQANLTVNAGKEDLTLYQWNMKIAKHYFCSICGTYVFHNKRAAPDHYGVNVKCLQGVDISDVPIRATKGDNMSVTKEDPKPHWRGPRV